MEDIEKRNKKDDAIRNKIRFLSERLKKVGMNGCFTGSCMLYCNGRYAPSKWEQKPDIDIFAYSHTDFVRIVDWLTNTGYYDFGTELGNEKSTAQERKKFEMSLKNPNGNKSYNGLQTVKLHTAKFCGKKRSEDSGEFTNDIVINVSYKPGCANIAAVLTSFDMSIIMRGMDIKSGKVLDLRENISENKYIARPNPFRNQDTDMFTTAYWVRQFDRVVKYWNRGYDTRPMAEFYLDQISKCLEQGSVFDSEAAHDLWDQYEKEFTEEFDKISEWLESVKED